MGVTIAADGEYPFTVCFKYRGHLSLGHAVIHVSAVSPVEALPAARKQLEANRGGPVTEVYDVVVLPGWEVQP